LEQCASDPAIGSDALRSLTVDALNRSDLVRASVFSKRLINEKSANLNDKLQHLAVLALTDQRQINAGRREGQGTNLQPPRPSPSGVQSQAQTGNFEFELYLSSLQKELASNPVTAAELAEWMNGHDLAQPALAWLNGLPAAIQKEHPIPPAKANCYLAGKDWIGLETYLDSEKWGDRDFLRFALLARCARELNTIEMADAYWQRAKRGATEQADDLAQLFRMAKAWGWTREADDALKTLADRFPSEKWPLQALVRTYMLQGDTARAYDTLKQALDLDKSNLLVKNDLAMLSLLLNRDADKAHAWAKQVYDSEPRNLAYASTYAFSLHVQGKTPESLKILQALPPEELKFPPVAAYYGLFLAASGQPVKAAAYLRLGESAPLLPEEKSLVAKALRTAR
jgi:Tfp pilus assembly protein PilF